MTKEEIETPQFLERVIEYLATQLQTGHYIDLKESVHAFRAALIEGALKVCDGNVAAAASLLNMKRSTLDEMADRAGKEELKNGRQGKKFRRRFQDETLDATRLSESD